MTVTFPNKLMWAFNPNYISITGADEQTATVTVGTTAISVALYEGEATVYISRLVQLLFYFPTSDRMVRVPMSVKIGATTYNNSSDMNYAIWGALEMGDRIGNYGAFDASRKPDRYKRIQCFTNFPFSVDVICMADTTIQINKDGTKSTLTVSLPQMKHLVMGTDFTAPLNLISFSAFTTGDKKLLIANAATEGYYLRWIDRHGFMQYYLFTDKDKSFKTKASNYDIDTEQKIGKLSFAGHNRPLSQTTERSVKLCATSLDQDTLDYVESIISAAIVDLYCGKTQDNKYLWKPVKVESGTYIYGKTKRRTLQDLEITIGIPNRITQSL